MVGLYVIGVDVGGTNTDVVIVCGKAVVAAAKRPTEENRTNGIVKDIRAALDSLADEVSRDNVVKNVARVCIGTTHFVNAVASCSQDDRKGLAQVAVIRLCGSASLALPPFCDFPEHLRQILCGGVYMVSGGFQYNLEAIKQLDQKELEGVAEEIRNANPAVRNVVISGVFSPHDDPENNQEQIAASIIQAKYPDLSCTLSHKVNIVIFYYFLICFLT